MIWANNKDFIFRQENCTMNVVHLSLSKSFAWGFSAGILWKTQHWDIFARLPTAKYIVSCIHSQSGKLLQTTYHRRSTYRYAKARTSESKMQNWYVVRRIKSVFSKLALLPRVWQRIFFTKLERRVKQRNSPFKKNSPFKTQVMSF